MNTSIFCYNCRKFTRTVEPILLKRFADMKIKVMGTCEKCLLGKCHEYEETSYCHLPKIIFSIPIGMLFVNNVYNYKNSGIRARVDQRLEQHLDKPLSLKVILDEFINSKTYIH